MVQSGSGRDNTSRVLPPPMNRAVPRSTQEILMHDMVNPEQESIVNEDDRSSCNDYMDDEHQTSEIFAHILDVFMKEMRLDNIMNRPEVGRGRGTALVRDANDYIKNKIRRQRKKILDKILHSRNIWHEKRSNPPFCRFIDKVSFTLGVGLSLITACLVGRSSLYFVNWYAYLIMFLVMLRLYLYRKEGYQYFLIDFCYFTTLLIYIYLYFFPDNHLVFVHIFAYANGPLAWAVPLWRNSLVFHDLDKLTSCAIHIFPMLLTFQLRWFPSSYSICSPDWPACREIYFSSIAVLPLLPYIIWQLAYTLKTQSKFLRLTKPVAIAHDDLIVTSFKWLLNSSSEGLISMLLRQFPTIATKEAAFMVLQFLYTFATMVPTILYFRYMHIHLLFVCAIIALAAWNGANFYVEVWTRRYKWTDQAVLSQQFDTDTRLNELKEQSHELSNRDRRSSS